MLGYAYFPVQTANIVEEKSNMFWKKCESSYKRVFYVCHSVFSKKINKYNATGKLSLMTI